MEKLKGMEGHKDMFEVGTKKEPQAKLSLSQRLTPQIKAYGLVPKDVAMETHKLLSSTPALKKATADTVMLSVALGLHLGLSLDKIDGEFATIPYKDGMHTIAQSQVMWKGYKRIVETAGKGIKELMVIAIKDIDKEIIAYEPVEKQIEDDHSTNGTFTLNADLVRPKLLSEVVARRKQKTTAYLGLIIVDKEIYGVENFGCLMTIEDIENWKKRYSPNKTLLSDYIYARKTVAKKVIRDFKPLLIMEDKDIISTALKEDQASKDANGNTIYVETKEVK